MLLLLLRHADAGVPDAARWPGDSERPLTDVGRETQRLVSERLRAAGIKLDMLYTSPLLRARQTAEIVAKVFNLNTIAVCDALAQPPDLQMIVRCGPSAMVGGTQTVGLTGHSPWMEETASLLLTGSRGGASIDFPKSGAMAILTDAIAPGAGKLIAFLTPELAA